MVTIVKQVRFSFWRSREIYQFPLPPGIGKPIQRILDFYQKADHLGDVVVTPGSLRFTRGSILYGLWFSDHPGARQKVSVHIENGIVTCEHFCTWGIGVVRVRTSRLYQEAQRLEAFLGGPVAIRPRRRRVFLGSPVFRVLYWCYRIVSGMR